MLTLDRFKLYAHIDHADDDELIEILIRIHTLFTRGVVCILTCGTTNRHNHDIVIVHAVFPGRLNFVQSVLCRLQTGKGSADGRRCGTIVCSYTPRKNSFRFELFFHAGVHLFHDRIQGIALCLKSLYHIYGIRICSLVLRQCTSKVTALDREIAGKAKECHLLLLICGKRQRTIIFQKDSTFFTHALTQILDGIQQLCCTGVIRFVGVILRCLIVCYHLCTLRSQELVNICTEGIDDHCSR